MNGSKSMFNRLVFNEGDVVYTLKYEYDNRPEFPDMVEYLQALYQRKDLVRCFRTPELGMKSFCSRFESGLDLVDIVSYGDVNSNKPAFHVAFFSRVLGDRFVYDDDFLKKLHIVLTDNPIVV